MFVEDDDGQSLRTAKLPISKYPKYQTYQKPDDTFENTSLGNYSITTGQSTVEMKPRRGSNKREVLQALLFDLLAQ